MRSLEAIINDENRAWKELHDIDNDIMTYVEMLNRRRDELREYFGELIPNRW